MKRLIVVMTVLLVVLLTGCIEPSEDVDIYTVQFETNGGTGITSVEVAEGHTVSEPTQPTKEDFDFVGWYSDSNFNVVFDFTTPIQGDLILYANWESLEPETFNVSFIGASGTELHEEDIIGGDSVSEPTNLSQEGYQLSGWYTDDTFTIAYDFSTPVTSDLTLYGRWVGVKSCYGESILENEFCIGFVTDASGIDDGAINELTWIGIELFVSELELSETHYHYLESNSDADYEVNVNTFAEEGTDLIVVSGFLFGDVLSELAPLFPNQSFLIIDGYADEPNVASVMFELHELGFLAGLVAGLQAQAAGKDTVGFIGGLDFSIIQGIEAGFEAGVWSVDPTMTVLVDYAGSFSDPQIGQTLAAKQYDDGAYIIYHASGGTGNGILLEAKDRRSMGEDVWAIGADRDMYTDGIYNGSNSAILTSVLLRVDIATFEVATDTYNGDFPGGEITMFGLNNYGIGLPDLNPNLSLSLLDALYDYLDDYSEGLITIPTVPSRLS